MININFSETRIIRIILFCKYFLIHLLFSIATKKEFRGRMTTWYDMTVEFENMHLQTEADNSETATPVVEADNIDTDNIAPSSSINNDNDKPSYASVLQRNKNSPLPSQSQTIVLKCSSRRFKAGAITMSFFRDFRPNKICVATLTHFVFVDCFQNKHNWRFILKKLVTEILKITDLVIVGPSAWNCLIEDNENKSCALNTNSILKRIHCYRYGIKLKHPCDNKQCTNPRNCISAIARQALINYFKRVYIPTVHDNCVGEIEITTK